MPSPSFPRDGLWLRSFQDGCEKGYGLADVHRESIESGWSAGAGVRACLDERGELHRGGTHRQLRRGGSRADGWQARCREDEANLLRPVPARLSPDGRGSGKGLFLREDPEEMRRPGDLCLAGF